METPILSANKIANGMKLKSIPTRAKAGRIRQTKPAEVRLDELMAAAEKLFLAKGIEETTINEIVEAAQVAKGTFYHYFTSKNDMLAALGQRYTTQFLARLREAVDSCEDGDWTGRLSTWIRASIDAYVETYRIHDIVYVNHHHHNRSNPEKNAILEQLLGILEGGVKAGVWSLDHPRVTALLVYSGVHGATDEIIASKARDRAAFAQTVTENCLRMVSVTEKPAKRSKKSL
jgi:AcrR family transcriptional regulator